MPTARQLELLKLIVTDRGISECLPTFFSVSTMCPVVGSASPCRRCSFVSLLWGLTDVLSRALDAELCRSGGAVQVVGVERGERGERRGLGTIPSLPGVRPTACRERRARCALEGRPLGAVTIP